MKKFTLIIFCLTLVVLWAERPCLADFYGYRDASGVFHVTNVPARAGLKLIMRETRPPSRAGVKGEKFENIIKGASTRYGVDPTLVKAVIKAESDFNAGVVSEDGAMGLMQLMPETARDLGVRDPKNPVENIDGGTKYLSRLIKTFNSDLPLAIAAYNAGENAVAKYGEIPPFSETRSYVKKVLRYYDQYRVADE
ncbi:MAG: lytic transglycosylase domain-containing protein [Thermodesulfobacteriota bacterium]